jgi:DNA (cytosine-5)-methyltransferase 1
MNINTPVSVTNAAQVLGLSVDTIRRWEKKGLIKASRSPDNYRLFDVSEIMRVHHKYTEKPAGSNYRILQAPKTTKYQVIDLFSGCGGTSLGMSNAGLQHTLLVELDDNAAATLRRNRPHWNILQKDVTKIDFREFEGSIDVVEGGFPCQAFSYAGRKMGFEDARGTLFYEFARCIKEAKPKIAIGENVRGLVTHDDGRTLSSMVDILKDIGYSVVWRVLRSQYHDVPQKRERLIIMAIRDDIAASRPHLYPKEKDYTISMREALADCPASPGQQYPESKHKVLAMVPPGGYWRDLPLPIQKKFMGASFYMGGGKTGMARRLSWEEPSLTLTCSPAQKQTERCHPAETRPLTVREYARIQTFPDDWEFMGSMSSQYKQIGNAVPVNLGYHIGRAVIAVLSGKIPTDEVFDVVNTSQQYRFQTMGRFKDL